VSDHPRAPDAPDPAPLTPGPASPLLPLAALLLGAARRQRDGTAAADVRPATATNVKSDKERR
jgi:hypothetical protein